ncbi:hypothetical protein [Histidinibacterium aquaticum]|uniref:Uncharacterized protein n=1 Tax=Histidinibacterium aquaticum TaxID=2613962 RepID=A0A5J5GCD0_9RHOB|nr:hypothetical protein [Histidinibacterium aquaticum]KAA9005657.1 hypothetical protein F3S47_17285 [Histidinibacterium aquaticum]
MTSISKENRLRPTRQEMALATTDRVARNILRCEAEARKDLTARLKASRINKEVQERRTAG